MRRLETFPWWPELLSAKDELSLRELAVRFGVTPGAITAALERTGVARRAAPPGPRSRRPRGIRAEPRPDPTRPDPTRSRGAPGAEPRADGAWRLVFDGEQVRVVVAASIREAVARAEAAGLGRVTGVEWVGATL